MMIPCDLYGCGPFLSALKVTTCVHVALYKSFFLRRFFDPSVCLWSRNDAPYSINREICTTAGCHRSLTGLPHYGQYLGSLTNKQFCKPLSPSPLYSIETSAPQVTKKKSRYPVRASSKDWVPLHSGTRRHVYLRVPGDHLASLPILLLTP